MNYPPETLEKILKEEVTLEDLDYAYYLSRWQVIVWRFFMKHVYPDWKKGHEEHRKLLKEGAIVDWQGTSYYTDLKNHL